jgi:hypothetical protein
VAKLLGAHIVLYRQHIGGKTSRNWCITTHQGPPAAGFTPKNDRMSRPIGFASFLLTSFLPSSFLAPFLDFCGAFLSWKTSA